MVFEIPFDTGSKLLVGIHGPKLEIEENVARKFIPKLCAANTVLLLNMVIFQSV